MNRRKLIDILVTSLAATLALAGIASKVVKLMDGHWLHATGPLIFYVLMFSMFIFRRSSQESLDHPMHYMFALCGTFLPFLLHIHTDTSAFLVWLSLPLELAGMLIAVVALSMLGRGFGIIAANRQIKTHGLYRYIRHPLYAGEALWLLALVLQNLSVWNVVLFAIQTACQVRRMLDEEMLLCRDAVYADYASQVRYRLIPGIF